MAVYKPDDWVFKKQSRGVIWVRGLAPALGCVGRQFGDVCPLHTARKKKLLALVPYTLPCTAGSQAGRHLSGVRAE